MDDGMQSGAGTVVKKAEGVEARKVEAGTATEMQVLVGEGDGAPHFAMRKFRMADGGGMPLHRNRVEHEQYVLTGKARIVIGDETHTVASGDVLYIPAGIPHAYEVLEAPFEFLCMVPNGPDEVEVLE